MSIFKFLLSHAVQLEWSILSGALLLIVASIFAFLARLWFVQPHQHHTQVVVNHSFLFGLRGWALRYRQAVFVDSTLEVIMLVQLITLKLCLQRLL